MSDEPRLTTLSISLPESQRTWIDEQVTARGYGTTSDYFRALIAAEQERRAQDRLEKLLIEGLESGPGEVATPEYWVRKQAELEARAFEMRKNKGLP